MSAFMDQIKKRARMQRKTIVLPEGTDIRTLKAASLVLEQNLANIIILGDKVEISKLAEGFDISKCEIIDPEKSDNFNKFVEQFFIMRKDKGMTIEKAFETIKNPLYYGCMMVKNNMADGMVAGAVNSTSNVLRSALQVVKTAPNVNLVSSFFVMCIPDCEYGEKGILVFSDAGLNEDPSAEQLAEIAILSAASFKQLVNAEPYVAMLSYSTYGSAKSHLTEKVVEATKIAKTKAPELKTDGELQLDAAIIESVGKSKAPGSNVAGKANVLIFPDLNGGNIGYKLVQRFAKAEAYGAIIQGLAKPINDLSRGCNVEDIVGVIAITAIQAQI